jgi:hypothetical protein
MAAQRLAEIKIIRKLKCENPTELHDAEKRRADEKDRDDNVKMGLGGFAEGQDEE